MGSSQRQAEAREVRWFIEGPVPVSLQPSGRGRHRTDAYHLRSLRPWLAFKRRAGAHLERKLRIGRVDLVLIDGVEGWRESWAKETPQGGQLRGDWLTVEKRWWRTGEVEIGHYRVADSSGWTVCVDTRSAPSRAGRATFEPWRTVLKDVESFSYPGWLGRRVGTSEPPV